MALILLTKSWHVLVSLEFWSLFSLILFPSSSTVGLLPCFVCLSVFYRILLFWCYHNVPPFKGKIRKSKGKVVWKEIRLLTLETTLSDHYKNRFLGRNVYFSLTITIAFPVVFISPSFCCTRRSWIQTSRELPCTSAALSVREPAHSLRSSYSQVGIL